MRFRLALGVSALAAMMAVPTAASAAVGNPYRDGQDLSVASAAPGNFRLDPRGLEPNCFKDPTFAHIDVGDSSTSVHVTNNDPRVSIDQVLVPGTRTGYQVYNTFDTGTVNNDPDIDTGQQALSLSAPQYRDSVSHLLLQDNVDAHGVIACVSDHEDAGQNEPYAPSATPADKNEVFAKNRPIIQPTVATLGQAASNAAKTYKLGMGYSIARWYSTANANAGGETPLLRLTDPMGFSLDKLVTTAVPGGISTTVAIDTAAGHVSIPPRIAGPRFDAVADGPGVQRVNDIDAAGEAFADPHFEDADYGQTSTFSVLGDAQSFCLGGPCAAIVAFGTQGDLPVTWSLKASLAAVDTLRSVSFTPAQFDAWEQGWQNYYCGKGPHPTMPLTPGTNSPDPRDCPVIVNPTEVRPTAAPTVVVNPTVVGTAAPASKAAPKKATAKQRAAYKRCLKKAAKKSSKKARSKARAKCARMPH
jgi:hypothetical protein